MAGRTVEAGVLVLLIGSLTGDPHTEGARPVPCRTRASVPAGITPVGPRAHALTSPWAVFGSAERAPAREQRTNGLPIELRPATLAEDINSLAGLSVRLTNARIVGVFDPRVFLVESDVSLRPLRGNRNRVLVFVRSGTLGVRPALLVGSAVVLEGTARTLLGIQVSREVPWPAKLRRDSLSRLDIRAALLATSVSTPDGVDLLNGGPPSAQ